MMLGIDEMSSELAQNDPRTIWVRPDFFLAGYTMKPTQPLQNVSSI
jgi:hypothetical protein